MALGDKRKAARLRVVDDDIRHESAHELESSMGTFGSEPEWHQAGEEALKGHEPIRGSIRISFPAFPTSISM